MESYGPEGGYTKGMGMTEKYNSWAAAQYRDKLVAACSDSPQPWSPSSPPAGWGVPSRPASAQATRKSRAGGAVSSSSLNPSRSGTPVSPPGSANEAFFERMGNTNALRPEDLPPSQGGRYAGFGSTPTPDLSSSSSSHPSYSTSSHSAPTLDEFQRNPLGALTKGWGLFSSAVATAGKEINESVLQPGMTRAQQLAAEGGGEDWKKYLESASNNAKTAAGWAGQRAGEGWDSLNHVAKEKGGLDLNAQLGRLGISGRPAGEARGNYGQLERAEDGVLTPPGGGTSKDEFFESLDHQPSVGRGPVAPVNAPEVIKPQKTEKKADDWDKDDEWKDF